MLNGRIQFHQLTTGHRSGTDAVLLAASTPVTATSIIDLGAGAGAVGLMAAFHNSKAHVTLVERDEALVDLARKNVSLNEMDHRVETIRADILQERHSIKVSGVGALGAGQADLVLTNPPFLNENRHRASPDLGRADAHMFTLDALACWMGTAVDLLRPKGRFIVIHRADTLDHLLAVLPKSAGSVSVRPVYAHAHGCAIRVIVEACKGGRAPFAIKPAVVLHEKNGDFTPLGHALHAGDARL